MAPVARPSKRTASAAPSEPAEKRTRKGKSDPVKDKCDLIMTTLTESTLPVGVKRMLIGLVPESLSLMKEERHLLQEQAVTMLASALASMEDTFEKSFMELESCVQEANTEKAMRDDSSNAAENELATTRQQLAELEKELASATTARGDSQKVLVQAESARVASIKAQEEFTEQKEKIESAMQDAYKPTQEGTEDKATKRRHCAALLAMGKKLKLEDSLVKALPEALKAPDERTQFDCIILQQFEAAIAQCLSSLETSLAQGAPAVEACESAVLSAQNACDAAEENKLKSKAAVVDSKKTEKDNMHALKIAEKSVLTCAKELSEIVASRDIAKQHLDQFLEGALASFRELKERAPASNVIENAMASQTAVEDKVNLDVMHEGSLQAEMTLEGQASEEPVASQCMEGKEKALNEMDASAAQNEKIEEIRADPAVLISLGA